MKVTSLPPGTVVYNKSFIRHWQKLQYFGILKENEDLNPKIYCQRERLHHSILISGEKNLNEYINHRVVVGNSKNFTRRKELRLSYCINYTVSCSQKMLTFFRMLHWCPMTSPPPEQRSCYRDNNRDESLRNCLIQVSPLSWAEIASQFWKARITIVSNITGDCCNKSDFTSNLCELP